jgi:hypothetical protein
MELNLNEAQSGGGSNSRVAIECSHAVFEQILADVEHGFYSVPHGGAEMGGVLYGSYDGMRILIQAANPLVCEHAYGPSFKLSVMDCLRLAALLQLPRSKPDLAGMVVLGWYHSHTRSEISFAGADIQIHDRFFPKPWQIALVLRPSAMRPTEVGLFLREADGTMCRSAPTVEASLTPAVRNERAQPGPDAAAGPRTGPDRNRPATAAVTPEHGAAVTPKPIGTAARVPIIVVPPEPPKESPDAVAPAPTERWQWAVAAVLFLVAIASAGYLSRAHWWPAPAVAGLQLHVTDRHGQLEIGWDRTLPALRLARSGTLEISEGTDRRIFPMDAEFLRRGSVNYVRNSEAPWTVRIAVTMQDGSEIQQQWAFVGDLGSGGTVPAQAAQHRPAPEATSDLAPSQLAELQRFRNLRPGPEPSEPTVRHGASLGASALPSRAAAVQPVIAMPSPRAVPPPHILADRATNPAPVQAATARPIPAEPRYGIAAAKDQPLSSAAPAAVQRRPLSLSAPASEAPSAVPASRPIAQAVPPPPPATSRPEPLVSNVAGRATPEPVASPPFNTAAPPAKVEPATQPAVAAPSLSGRWTFGRTSPSGSPFPPESVSLLLLENGGVIQGSLAGRYRAPKSSGLKPDVRFSFQGPAHAGNMRFPWAGSDGTKGSVELIRLPNRSDWIEVVWYSQDRKFIFDDVLVRVAR